MNSQENYSLRNNAFDEEIKKALKGFNTSVSYFIDCFGVETRMEIDFIHDENIDTKEIDLDIIMKVIEISKKFSLKKGSFKAEKKNWLRISLDF